MREESFGMENGEWRIENAIRRFLRGEWRDERGEFWNGEWRVEN